MEEKAVLISQSNVFQFVADKLFHEIADETPIMPRYYGKCDLKNRLIFSPKILVDSIRAILFRKLHQTYDKQLSFAINKYEWLRIARDSRRALFKIHALL